ncbi:MAG: S8 family serine peptidase [Anaerolineales bacterium]|nr:S8 family serine peptidase [Anaerolineales bacterium]
MLKANINAGVTVLRIDPNDQEPLAGTVVGSSSRGPTMNNHFIKPEIGAPGASVSAIAGTGTGTEPFGGTSGAAPMVAGAAALLKSARPYLSNFELKALLVNTGETDINNKAAILGGYKAPITRIGGGEVRVDRAVAAPIAAWVTNSKAPAISLGFDDWSVEKVTKRISISVQNYEAKGKTYKICTSYRFADDQANGAVTVSAPNTVYVPANGLANFGVKVELKPAMLNAWALNSGSLGASADTLTAAEFDGYVTLVEKTADCSSVNGVVHVPWQMLPRKAGEVTMSWLKGPNVKLKNRGIAAAPVESYSMIGVSPNQPEGGLGENNPNPDLRYVGYATYPVPAGYCSDDPSFVMAFAVNTFERQTHANAPLSIEIDLDVDQDGNVDYAVYTRDVSTNLSDGRNLVWVYEVATGTQDAWFYTDHQTNSSNTVLTICGEQIGMNANNFFDPMDLMVFAVDNYFTGLITDYIDGITISPLGEQYLGVFENGGVGFTNLAPKGVGDTDKLAIQDYGFLTNNTENGLLLLYRDGAIPWVEAAAIYVK